MSETIPIQTATVLETIKNDTGSVMLIDLLSKMIVADNNFNGKLNALIEENNFLKGQVGELSERLALIELGGEAEIMDLELEDDDDDADTDQDDDSD